MYNRKDKQYDPDFLRSYDAYNCKVPKKIRTVYIIRPVRIIGTLEQSLLTIIAIL